MELQFSRLLAASVALAGVAVASVNPVIIQGQEFVDSVTKDRVMIIGVEYVNLSTLDRVQSLTQGAINPEDHPHLTRTRTRTC